MPLQQPLGPIGQLQQQHDTLRAQFSKLGEAKQLLDHTRRELDGLLKLGDAVEPDDVVKVSGRLVGHGFGSAQMAELLATMPAVGGQPLAEWLKVHDLDVTRREAQMGQIQAGLGHHLAVAGLRMLAAQHLGSSPQPPQGNQPIQSGGIAVNQPSANPLMGGQS
jgi:hypothetical protein